MGANSRNVSNDFYQGRRNAGEGQGPPEPCWSWPESLQVTHHSLEDLSHTVLLSLGRVSLSFCLAVIHLCCFFQCDFICPLTVLHLSHVRFEVGEMRSLTLGTVESIGFCLQMEGIDLQDAGLVSLCGGRYGFEGYPGRLCLGL